MEGRQGSFLSSSRKNRLKSLEERGEKNGGAYSTEDELESLDSIETDDDAMREKVALSSSCLWKGGKKQGEEEEEEEEDDDDDEEESLEERQEKVKSLILTFERETGCIIEALHFLIKYFPSTIFRYEGYAHTLSIYR